MRHLFSVVKKLSGITLSDIIHILNEYDDTLAFDDLIHKITGNPLFTEGYQLGKGDLEPHLESCTGLFDLYGEKRNVIHNYTEMLARQFPFKDFIHSHRINDKQRVEEKFKENGIRAFFDAVGLRIVPRNHKDFYRLVEFMKTQPVMFAINTYLYSREDFARISGSSSPHYRAIHFYVCVNSIPVEVQVRLRGVDLWSNIQHPTIYKPKIEITDNERTAINDFGEIANIVDLELL